MEKMICDIKRDREQTLKHDIDIKKHQHLAISCFLSLVIFVMARYSSYFGPLLTPQTKTILLLPKDSFSGLMEGKKFVLIAKLPYFILIHFCL
jgi:hypothetical protein